MARPTGWLEGPILLGWTALAVTGALAVLVVEHGDGEEAVRAALRVTARSSLVLLAAAFAAGPLHRLLQVPATAWLLRNRRWVGLSMALSHGLHGAAILTLALRWPAAGAAIDPSTRVIGSVGYGALAVLVATSSDRAVARLGRARWRALHRASCWVLWGVFALSYLPGAGQSLGHALGTALLAGVAALRLWAWFAPAARGRGSRSAGLPRS